MDEDQQVKTASNIKTVTEPFKVSVHIVKYAHNGYVSILSLNLDLKSGGSIVCIKLTYKVFLFVSQVIGSVLYFTTFSVDKLGQPLLDENPQLTDGWEVPTYL